MAKIYAIESPVLEMGRNLKNKLSPVKVNVEKRISVLRVSTYICTCAHVRM